jgi:hypothetical protein
VKPAIRSNVPDTKELSWQAFDPTGSVSFGRMRRRYANGTTLMTQGGPDARAIRRVSRAIKWERTST